MPETVTTLIWAAAALGVVATICLCALRAWRGWLELKRLELAAGRSPAEAAGGTGVRIEIADMRERLRKLEAIATGVDL